MIPAPMTPIRDALTRPSIAVRCLLRPLAYVDVNELRVNNHTNVEWHRTVARPDGTVLALPWFLFGAPAGCVRGGSMPKDSARRRTGAGVRWKRFLALTVPGLLVAGTIMVLTGQGALAASFAVSGQNYKISADRLDATGMVLYGDVRSGLDGTKHPVGTAGFKTATLYNLCLSTVVNAPTGVMTIRMSAGGGDTPVQATNMIADLDQLSGNATFDNIDIGIDASKQTKGPVSGPSGLGALQTDKATIVQPRLRAWAVASGTFKLTGLKIDVSFGKHECY
jgi:hypothetical protein